MSIGERRRERIEFFHLLAHFSNGHNGLGWINLKQGSRKSMARIRACGLCCAAFPGALAESWLKSRMAKVPSRTLIWDAGIAGGTLSHCTAISAVAFAFLSQVNMENIFSRDILHRKKLKIKYLGKISLLLRGSVYNQDEIPKVSQPPGHS